MEKEELSFLQAHDLAAAEKERLDVFCFEKEPE
jgi:hypothetical protein